MFQKDAILSFKLSVFFNSCFIRQTVLYLQQNKLIQFELRGLYERDGYRNAFSPTFPQVIGA